MSAPVVLIIAQQTYYYTCPIAKKGYKECIGVSVRNDYADVAAWEKAVHIIRNPRLIAQEIARKRQEDPTADEIASARQGIEKLNPSIQNLVETIAETPAGEGRRMLSLRLDELAQKRLTFQLEIDRLNRLHDQWQEAEIKLDEFETWCRHARQHLDSPDYTPSYREKRDALEYLGIRAILYKMDHQPFITVEVSPPQVMSLFGSTF